MSIEIKMPYTNFDEVEVINILVNIGDYIKYKQKIIIVQNDESCIHIPSLNNGIVKEIKVFIGSKIKYNELILILDDQQSINTTDIDKITKKIPANNNIKNINMPDIGDDTVEVVDILVKLEDIIYKDQSIIIVEGDKVSMEVPSTLNGKIYSLNVKIGDKINTGSLIMNVLITEDCIIKKQNNVIKNEKNNEKKSYLNLNNNIDKKQIYVHATPKIRRLAREFGINLKQVKSTGPKGRILKEDIDFFISSNKHLNDDKKNFNTINNINIIPWPSIQYNKFGDVEQIKLNNIQKISSENFTRNWIMIPHVTQHNEIDITELEEFRKKQNLKTNNIKKITLLPFIMKAVVKALTIFPKFNSSISTDKEHLILKKYINIGIAVDTDKGLLVPVFTNINHKSIIDISEELDCLSKKARSGKLTAKDIQGGTFTISSLGNIGGSFFTPIINAPEVAILGISKASIKPLWNGEKFNPRFILPLSLSFDHRVINGADGSRFMNLISYFLSDIRNLLM